MEHYSFPCLSKWRNVWVRDEFCSQPFKVPGVPTKSLLESSVEKFKPHIILQVANLFVQGSHLESDCDQQVRLGLGYALGMRFGLGARVRVRVREGLAPGGHSLCARPAGKLGLVPS